MTFGGRGAGPRKAREEGTPFRLLLIADFGGRAARRAAGEAPPLRRPVKIDAAELDRAIAAVAPALPIGATGETLRPVALDDFHPDHLFARLAMFEEPRRLRGELRGAGAGSQTFAAVEAWVWRASGAAPAAGAPAAAPAATESEASALERLLGRAPGADTPATPAGALQGILEKAVRPHVTSEGDVQRRALLQSVLDEALASQMRAVLAAPALRAAEAAWRGVDRLARAVDTDGALSIALFDACPQDLDDALDAAGGDLGRSELHRLLVERDPWTVIAVAWECGLDVAQLKRLASLGALAGRAGAILLADASLALLGCASPEQAADPTRWQAASGGDAAALWQALRESPLASSVGLVVPRVLARLPYGKKTDPIDAFPFEELSGAATRAPAIERVWGSGAFALAQLHAAAFREQGWTGDVDGTELDDLPSHTFDDDGESRLVPAGEVAWSERAVEPLLARGITPLLARRDRAALHLVRTCSIASPPSPLVLSTGDA